MFGILIFAAMVAIHFIYAGQLEWSIKTRYWLVYIIGTLIIAGVFHAHFIAAIFGAGVALGFYFKAFSNTNSSGEV